MAEKIAYFRLGKMWDPAFKDEDFKYALTVLDYACRRFRKNEQDYERFVNNAVNQLLSIMLCQTEIIISKDKNLSILGENA